MASARFCTIACTPVVVSGAWPDTAPELGNLQ